MSVHKAILKALKRGPTPAKEIMALDYPYGLLQAQLKIMVETGEIYRFGKARATIYSLQPELKIEAKQTKPKPKINLPDLPPIMLQWGGYTDIEPDPRYAVLIEGVQ